MTKEEKIQQFDIKLEGLEEKIVQFKYADALKDYRTYINNFLINGLRKKDIDLDYFEERLIQNNKNIDCQLIWLSEPSDPAQDEKIITLEKEIKELNETIEILEKKMLDAKSRNYKLLNQISDLEENAAPGEVIQNPRGAGRKPKITPEQIAMIQMLRAQGKKLQEIQEETGISYGNIQKYCKLISHPGKAKNEMLLY